jgi:hypothetical protein
MSIYATVWALRFPHLGEFHSTCEWVTVTTLYWRVRRRIRQDILKEKRAEYGEEIVSALRAQLEAEIGLGFGEKNLLRMLRFAERLPDGRIVAALRRQLSWTNFVSVIFLDDPLKCVTVQRRVTEAVT